MSDSDWAFVAYDNGESGCPNCLRFRLYLCENGLHRCENCGWSPECGEYVQEPEL